MYKSKKGFTIIEFVIVMAIIGILVLMASPKFMKYIDKAYETKIKNDLSIMEKEVNAKTLDNLKIIDKSFTMDKQYIKFLIDTENLYDKNGLVTKIPEEMYNIKVKNLKNKDLEKYDAFIDKNSNIYITSIDKNMGYEAEVEVIDFEEEELKTVNSDLKQMNDLFQFILSENSKLGENRRYGPDLLPGLYTDKPSIQKYYVDLDRLYSMNTNKKYTGKATPLRLFKGKDLITFVNNDNKLKAKFPDFKIKNEDMEFAVPHVENYQDIYYIKEINTLTNEDGFKVYGTTIIGHDKEKIQNYIKKNNGVLVIPNTVVSNGRQVKVESLGLNAFKGLKVNKVEFKTKSLTELEQYSLAYMDISGELVLPKEIEFISRASLRGNNITKIDFENLTNLKVIGPYALYGNNLTDVIFPESLERLTGSYSFGNNKISNLDLRKANKLKKINTLAFSNNNLTEVFIPKNITEVGPGAFHRNDFTSKDNIIIEDIINTDIPLYHKHPAGNLSYTFSNKKGEHFKLK